RSGLGKSSLLIRLRNELKQSPTVLCDEVKQRMSFGALLHIFRCISTQLRSFGIKPDAFRFGENRKSSSSDSPLVSRSSKLAFGSKTSLVVLPEIIDTEWAYLEKVMEALGISRATSRLLAIIPGMKAFQVNERLPGGDLTGRIAFIIYQVLEMARTLGFHSCFICDDIQEWEENEYFDGYQSASTCWIQLEPLSFASLAELVHALVAVLVAIRGLKTQDAPNSLSSLVLDREKAISAQMDMLPKSFQTVLAVASIVGQMFDLETVAGAIQRLPGRQSVAELTATDLELEIRTRDRFGLIVCKSIENMEYAFRHYLVQQGILSTLLPKRRESIHRAVIQTLEEKLRMGGDDSYLLPVIIRHVMELKGEVELKTYYLHRGFLTAEKT
ncbi:hypothetical protein DFJ73DRAFT_766532, partial [Zopfochytrium polystomum]